MRSFLTVILAAFLTLPAMAGEVVDIQTPRGETVRLLVESVPDAAGVAVLFAGGKGRLKISESGGFKSGKGNFLIRSAEHFRTNGWITAKIDTPSDRPKSLDHFRGTEEHAQDIGAVVAALRARFGKPVWLVGTSRGSISAANAGVRLVDTRADGIVLTASVIRENKRDAHVLDMPLERITGPVLIVHHRSDECVVTPPDRIADVEARLTQASPLKTLWYSEKGNARGKECGSKHYHGFIDIEERVVRDITAWMTAN